jgi:hypothetical protein
MSATQHLGKYSALMTLISKEAADQYFNSLSKDNKTAFLKEAGIFNMGANALRSVAGGIGGAWKARGAAKAVGAEARALGGMATHAPNPALAGEFAQGAQAALARRSTMPTMGQGFTTGRAQAIQANQARAAAQAQANTARKFESAQGQYNKALQTQGRPVPNAPTTYATPATQNTQTTQATNPKTPEKPGFIGKWMGRIGMGAMAANALGQGSQEANQRLASFNGPESLLKQALHMGLQDAIDLGSYGLLLAGPAAELIAPNFAHQYHAPLLGADLAGLALLARHHIPGLKPEAEPLTEAQIAQVQNA